MPLITWVWCGILLVKENLLEFGSCCRAFPDSFPHCLSALCLARRVVVLKMLPKFAFQYRRMGLFRILFSIKLHMLLFCWVCLLLCFLPVSHWQRGRYLGHSPSVQGMPSPVFQDLTLRQFLYLTGLLLFSPRNV